MSECYFCDETERLEQHHVVPQRYDGDDTSENLVSVCPTCHSKLEALYDARFYNELGVSVDGDSEQDSHPYKCGYGNCTADCVHSYTYGDNMVLAVCNDHHECGRCGGVPDVVIGAYSEHAEDVGPRLRCDSHAVCRYGDCRNRDVLVYENDIGNGKQLCETHAEELRSVEL